MKSASNSGTRVGHPQVSTVAQTLDQQNTALAQPASPRLSDTMSDANDDRPGLAALMQYDKWHLDELFVEDQRHDPLPVACGRPARQRARRVGATTVIWACRYADRLP